MRRRGIEERGDILGRVKGGTRRGSEGTGDKIASMRGYEREREGKRETRRLKTSSEVK